jgi:ribosomal protein S18 acetylase RimI-like enzyme
MTYAAIHLQPMEEKDVEEATRLISRALNQAEGEWAAQTFRFHFDCRRHNLPDGRDYLVWKPDGTLRGLTGLHHDLWGPAENVWLAWFAVDPEFQRQGIGGRMLRIVEERATDKGYRKLLVETYRHAEFDPALAFYRARGFQEIGSISNYLPDGSDMVVFGKVLS